MLFHDYLPVFLYRAGTVPISRGRHKGEYRCKPVSLQLVVK